jgi:hypothetical protein
MRMTRIRNDLNRPGVSEPPASRRCLPDSRSTRTTRIPFITSRTGRILKLHAVIMIVQAVAGNPHDPVQVLEEGRDSFMVHLS